MHHHPSDSSPLNECGHTCAEIVTLTASFSSLLSSTLDVVQILCGLDGRTWALSQAQNYCDGFCDLHPSVTVAHLVHGIDVSTEALVATARFERGN